MKRFTVSVNEACQIVGLGRSKIYELANEGRIEVVKVGRRSLVKVASLAALVGAQEVM